jgi:lipopolysaccharide assembly protein A
MRFVIQALVALVFVAVGWLFGAFNPQTVHIDFHVFQVPASLGVALLIALLAGAILGGLAVTVGIVWPLRRRLRKASRDAATAIRTPQQQAPPT